MKLSLSLLKDLAALASELLKLKDLVRSRCTHSIYLAHDNTKTVQHIDESYCDCKPRYQCLMCGVVFENKTDSYRPRKVHR